MISDSQIRLVLELVWRATWQSAALALVILLIVAVARKQITPRWRVILWSLPLCRMILLIVPASSWSLFYWIELTPRETIASNVVVAPSRTTPFPEQQSSTTPAEPTAPVWSVYVPPPVSSPTPSADVKPTVVPVASATNPLRTSNAAEKVTGSQSIVHRALTSLFWIWSAGVFFCLVLRIANHIRLVQTRSNGTPLEREDLRAYLVQRCQALKIRREVSCLVLPTDLGPASTGLVRPKILIPENLMNELNATELMSILEHELQHIKRLDVCYLMLSNLACTLHWFNPLAYWLAMRVRSEMEFAVDAETVGQVDAQGKKVYGELLIRLASRRSRSLGLAPMADRPIKVGQRIEELFAPVRNSKTRTAISCVLVLMLVITGLSEVASTQEQAKNRPASAGQKDTDQAPTVAAQPQPADEEFELLVIDTNGKPVPEAQVEIRGARKARAEWIVEGSFVKVGTYGLLVKATKDGQLKMRFPAQVDFSFFIHTEGYGPYCAQWQRSKRPASFTAELELARRVGGIVVDENGKPVVGAEVHPSLEYKKRPGDESQLRIGTRLETDSDGRWSYPHLPRSMTSVGVAITHPQFKPKFAELATDTFEVKGDQNASQLIPMDKGLTVKGKIVDSSGNPIAGALIRTRMVNDVRTATSNEQGLYELTGCMEGVAPIIVSAPKMAVDRKSVHIESKMESVDFTMQPGGHVRIRVIDEMGKPVPKAVIFFQRWREPMYGYFELDHVNKTADENGIWEWNEAPRDEFLADIVRPGGMSLASQQLIARAEEYVFTCPSALKIVGRVIDAETKLPIKAFQVIPGVRNSPQHLHWSVREAVDGEDGAFEYTESHGYPALMFKVQAQGYVSNHSRDVKPSEGRVELTFEMKRGVGIEAKVTTPDGKLAVGAKCALGVAGSQIQLRNGTIDDSSTFAQRTTVDTNGILRFPAQATPYQLIVIHESGFARIRADATEQLASVQLTSWAHVEGTFRIAKKPIGGVQLSLYSGAIQSYGSDVANISNSCEVVTAEDGTFRFERVFPGHGTVGRYILRMVNEGAKEVTSSTSLSSNFVSGETTRLEFGATGSPVVGTLVKPPTYQDKVLWSFADIDIESQVGPGPIPLPEELKNDPEKSQRWFEQWKETDAGKAWFLAAQAAEEFQRLAPRYRATCDSAGRFRIDDMPPGTYNLSVRFTERPATGQLRDFNFTVTSKDAEQGKLIDLGKLQLETHNN